MAERPVHIDGKTKRIYQADNEDQVIIEFKDAESDFDGEKKAKFKNKGALRNTISNIIFEYLEGYNIPTHFASVVSEIEMKARKLSMIPITVVVRNVAAGSLSERFKIEKGVQLKYPVLEYYLKDEKLDNPLILESHAYAFDYASPEEMKHISRLASKVNAVLKSFLERRRIKLVDYKLEFGRYKNIIMLGDEITPDTCRLWDIENGSIKDNYFLFDNSKAASSYQEIHDRIVGS